MNTPFFSIICPTFNSAAFVERSIESVIAQTFQNFELILIDDCSTDNTCKVLETIIQQYPDKQIKLLREPHRGPGATRNAGIRAAEGKWIAFLDSDDVWVPEKLVRVHDAILKNPAVNFLCHDEQHIHLDGTNNIINSSAWYNPNVALPRQLYRCNLFSTSAVVCSKELLMDMGMFNECLMSAQDYELWLRLSEQMNVYFINETLGAYYDRKGNISSQKRFRHLINMYKIYFAHRNKGGYRLYIRQMVMSTLAFVVHALKKRFAHHSENNRMKIIKKAVSFFWPVVALGNQIKQCLCSQGTIRVLIYHDIPLEEQAAFAQQIQWLKQHYNIITPDQFNQYLTTGHIPKGINVLITFDDGFQSNRVVCEKVLDPLGIKAIFFILPDLVTATLELANKMIYQKIFDGQSYTRTGSHLNTMDVADIQSLIYHGHSIGSHTRYHTRLSTLSDEQHLRDEIIGSADQLEKMFNINVRHFAYPFGAVTDINQQAMQLACQRYDYVHSGVRGKNAGGKTKVIFRHEISPAYTKRYVRLIVEGGGILLIPQCSSNVKKNGT